ncbi:MAG: hypothetical protein MMC33_004124 [Icmadophila ericetorum]|nr:hypothetical protein [Icmadophila ericetorum]
MKRASSVPTAASSSVKLSRSTASAKALFRIELPTIKSYKLHPPFLGRSKPRTPVSATTSECGCSRLGLSQFHGFAVDDQEISSLRSTPLTPPDETSFDLPNMTEPEHSAVDANATISTRAPEEPIPEMQGLCLESVASTWSNQGPTDNRPNSEQHSEADQRESEAASSADLPSQSISAPSPWLDETIDIALPDFSASCDSGHAIRVLSQVQPCPSVEMEKTAAEATFQTLVNAIQTKIQLHATPFILVTHALPPRFTLNKIPTSPPGTPSVSGGEDYFSTNVFSSAVPIVNRHDIFGQNTPGGTMLSSPCLAVPPASIDVALLERFIPPTSPNEYADLFTPDRPSVLVDRLVELSKSEGTMIFIYPTRRGAETFKSLYLGPIFEPLLRSMMNSHNLSADIAMDLGEIAAVHRMTSFESMQAKLNSLLERLNGGSSQGPRKGYRLIHSRTKLVHIERPIWAEWFIQQETERFRDITTRYFSRARRLPAESHINYAVLTRELVEGIQERKYVEGTEPRAGIELGVFVIRRTA